jgi:glucose-6-phosphate-specific signal transduction histidine kinase
VEALIVKKEEAFKDIEDEGGFYFKKLKEFSVNMGESIQWNSLEKEIEFLEKDITLKMVMECYIENLIEKPKIAVFRVFSEKFKDIAKEFKLEEIAEKGEMILKEEMIDVYLNN